MGTEGAVVTEGLKLVEVFATEEVNAVVFSTLFVPFVRGVSLNVSLYLIRRSAKANLLNLHASYITRSSIHFRPSTFPLRLPSCLNSFV